MTLPFTAEEMYPLLEPHQIAQLHLAAMEREGKTATAGKLAYVAGVSLQCAKRQIRRRKREGSPATQSPRKCLANKAGIC